MLFHVHVQLLQTNVSHITQPVFRGSRCLTLTVLLAYNSGIQLNAWYMTLKLLAIGYEPNLKYALFNPIGKIPFLWIEIPIQQYVVKTISGRKFRWFSSEEA